MKILRVDADERKIGLSRKRVEWAEERPQPRTAAAAQPRPLSACPPVELRGGVGSGSGPLIQPPAGRRSPQPEGGSQGRARKTSEPENRQSGSDRSHADGLRSSIATPPGLSGEVVFFAIRRSFATSLPAPHQAASLQKIVRRASIVVSGRVRPNPARHARHDQDHDADQLSAVQSPLETYLREINETPLLSSDDEHELAIAIGAGNVEARDRMVRANLRLVVNIARGYTGKGLGLQDLIEEGNLGLLRAVEGFDPAMGTRFSTYASYWIKQSIKRALDQYGQNHPHPRLHGRAALEVAAGDARGWPKSWAARPPPRKSPACWACPARNCPSSRKPSASTISRPQTDQAEAGWSLGEMIMDEHARNPDDELVESDNLTHVFQQLESMDPREATVLRMRFGLDDKEPRTLKEIGESLGLTRERVRQIETEALNKLGQSLEGTASPDGPAILPIGPFQEGLPVEEELGVGE